MNPTDPNSPRIGRRTMADQLQRLAHLRLRSGGRQALAENARLRQDRDKFKTDAERLARRLAGRYEETVKLREQIEWMQARLDTANAHVEELRGQRDEARASLTETYGLLLEARLAEGAMRPVVEAAEAWRTEAHITGAEHLAGPYATPLMAAVDAWRAAQPGQTAPTDRPTARVSQDRGADDGAGTEGSQAQGGAQGAGWRREGKVVHFDIPAPAGVDLTGAITVGPFEFEVTAPADPAGLDAAIEAAVSAYDAPAPAAGMKTRHERALAAAVRAAAPHLRAAALNEAADELDRIWREQDGIVWYVEGESRLANTAQWLRERAGRIGGGE